MPRSASIILTARRASITVAGRARTPTTTTAIHSSRPAHAGYGRSAGARNSWKVGCSIHSTNKKWIFIATDAWYNYGNALAPENTNIWVLDGRYRFSHVPAKGPYHGLLLRYRYIQRTLSNTFCGDAGTTSCPAGSIPGATEFGGLPLFKYNRAKLEYDF